MTTFPNSTELIEMAREVAHREWTNRQERKGHNDEAAWTSGWISGYLTGRGESMTPAPQPQEPNCSNPCEEQGCTDTEQCDEICEHQRMYTPAMVKTRVKHAAAQARDKKLTDVIAILNERAMIDENNQYYLWLEDAECAVDSLRTPKAVKEQ